MLHRSFERDTRGASYVEYIILVGAIGLVALAGFRTFGHAALAGAERNATCVAALDASCADGHAFAASGRSAFTTSAQSALTSSPAASTASPNRGTAYWMTSIPRGFALGAWSAVAGTATLVASATPLGFAYSALTGTPNTAVGTAKHVATLALWAAPPLRAYAALGGPDPIRDVVRGIGRSIEASWRRDPGETIGRGVFEAGTALAPFAHLKSAASVADLAETAEATAVGTASGLARTTDAEAIAAVSRGVEARAMGELGVQAQEVPSLLKAGNKLGEGNFSKVYESTDGDRSVAVIVPSDQSAASFEEILSHQTPPEYGGPPVPSNGVRQVAVEIDGEVKQGVVMSKLEGTTLAPMFPRESPGEMLERMMKGLPEPDLTPHPEALADKVQPSHIESFQRAVDKATADGVVLEDLDGHNVMLGPDGQTIIFDTKPTKVSAVPESDRELYEDLLRAQPARAKVITDAMQHALSVSPPRGPVR